MLVGEGDQYFLGETDYDSQYYDQAGLRVGRVEICIGGRYGTICDDYWDHDDASVLCKQLGFSPHGKTVAFKTFMLQYCFGILLGALALVNQIFSEEELDIFLMDVACNGSENMLTACNIGTHETFCGSSDDAGAVCQGENDEM